MAGEEPGQQEEVAQEEVAVEEPQPVVLPPRPEELVIQATASTPELITHQAALETVFVCYTSYVTGDAVVKTDPETALMELDLARGWRAGDVSRACDDVMKGLAVVWEGLENDFAAEAMEERIVEVDFDMVTRRFAAERQEQDALISQARKLLDLVKTVSGQLGIPNPDAGPLKPLPPSRAKVVAEAAARTLVGGLRTLASPVVVFGEAELELETPPPSWKTPPVFLDTDPSILKLQKVVARRAAQEEDVHRIWAGLEGLGLNREAVTNLLDEVAKKARQQIAQSEEIMRNATASYEQFSGRIEAFLRIHGVVHAVNGFFFPKMEKA